MTIGVFQGLRAHCPINRAVRRLCAIRRAVLLFSVLIALSGQVLADNIPLHAFHAAVENGNLLGSSFELRSGLAATNAHVLKGKRIGSSVKLFIPGREQSIRGVVVAISKRMDLALLKVPPGMMETPRLGTSTPGSGQMQLIGVVAKRGPRAIQAGSGYVLRQRVHAPRFGTGMVLRTKGVTFGFSGGPVFDSEDQVVGMLTALRDRRGATEALVIPISLIRAEASRLLRISRSETRRD